MAYRLIDALDDTLRQVWPPINRRDRSATSSHERARNGSPTIPTWGTIKPTESKTIKGTEVPAGQALPLGCARAFELVVIITRGTYVKPLRSFRKHFLAACLSHAVARGYPGHARLGPRRARDNAARHGWSGRLQPRATYLQVSGVSDVSRTYPNHNGPGTMLYRIGTTTLTRSATQ